MKYAHKIELILFLVSGIALIVAAQSGYLFGTDNCSDLCSCWTQYPNQMRIGAVWFIWAITILTREINAMFYGR